MLIDRKDADISKLREELRVSRDLSYSLKTVLETLKSDTEIKLGKVTSIRCQPDYSVVRLPMKVGVQLTS